MLGSMAACTTFNSVNAPDKKEIKADVPKPTISKERASATPIRARGVYPSKQPGLTPKEYGFQFGNGCSRIKRTNYLHLSRMMRRAR